jgi:SAM-dependent methyltransferase
MDRAPSLPLIHSHMNFVCCSTVNKTEEKVHFINQIRRWTGSERVLEVGCGTGSFLLEAAKRINGVPTTSSSPLCSAVFLSCFVCLQVGAQAVGIDLWPHPSRASIFHRLVLGTPNSAQRSTSPPASPVPTSPPPPPTPEATEEEATDTGLYRTLMNAFAEGVSDRVKLVRGDARRLLQPMPDRSFDVIICGHTSALAFSHSWLWLPLTSLGVASCSVHFA